MEESHYCPLKKTDDFSKQKIVWADLARTGNAFTFDNTGAIVLNTCYILTTSSNNTQEIKYLLAILNSKLILFYMNLISSKLDETGWRWFKQFVEVLPIANTMINSNFNHLVDEIMNSQTDTIENEINQQVFNLYNLSEDEIKALLDKKISKSAIARIMGVHRLTVADFIKEQSLAN